MLDKKQKQWVIIAIIVVVVIILILVIPKKEPAAPEEVVPAPEQAVLGEEAFLPEAFEKVEVPKGTPKAPEPTEIIKQAKKTKEPVAVVEGTSKITEEGTVITESGEATAPQEVIPGAPESPKQSEALSEEEKQSIEGYVVQLEVSRETGFTPNRFSAKPGQAVTLSLTSVDGQNHVFRFKDRILYGVAISVYGGETKVISFNAPDTPGIYEFIDTSERTNIGTMYVTE